MTPTTSYFASQLKMRPGLEGLSAVGTDGEEALSSAFKSVFPGSSHLLCQFHKCDNITVKLRLMNMEEPTTKQILGDIFGSGNGETQYSRLIDSTDVSDFNTKLQNLKPKWDLLCPVFFEWFVKNEVELMFSSMIASVHSTAGLGSPPKSFTTNESLNHLHKQKVDYKKNEWPAFNKLFRELCEEQQKECEKAVFGGGEYELLEEFKNQEVPHSRGIQMSPEQ